MAAGAKGRKQKAVGKPTLQRGRKVQTAWKLEIIFEKSGLKVRNSPFLAKSKLRGPLSFLPCKGSLTMNVDSTKIKRVSELHVHLAQSNIHHIYIGPRIMDKTPADRAVSMDVTKVTEMQISILDVQAAATINICHSIRV